MKKRSRLAVVRRRGITPIGNRCRPSDRACPAVWQSPWTRISSNSTRRPYVKFGKNAEMLLMANESDTVGNPNIWFIFADWIFWCSKSNSLAPIPNALETLSWSAGRRTSSQSFAEKIQDSTVSSVYFLFILFPSLKSLWLTVISIDVFKAYILFYFYFKNSSSSF